MVKYIRILLQRLVECFLEPVDRLLEECPRSDHRVTVVAEEGWNPQSSRRKSRPVVYVVKIIFDIPVDVRIRHDVHTRIGEVRDLRQSNGRSVGLDSIREEFVHVFDKSLDRYLLVSVVSAHVDSGEGDELDLRMRCEARSYGIRIVLVRSERVEHSV